MSEDQSVPSQIEALRDLLSSEGWQLFTAHVMKEAVENFGEQVARALNNPEEAIVLDQMRQIAAIRKAGLRWLQWPKERVDTLTRQVITANESHVHSDNRRPRGL